LTTEEYLNYCDMFLEFCGPEYVEELFSHFLMDAQVHFAHGDLLPGKILVGGSKLQLSSTGRVLAITQTSGSMVGRTIRD